MLVTQLTASIVRDSYNDNLVHALLFDQSTAFRHHLPNNSIPVTPDYRPPVGRLINCSIPQRHALNRLKKEIKQEGWFIQEFFKRYALSLQYILARLQV